MLALEGFRVDQQKKSVVPRSSVRAIPSCLQATEAGARGLRPIAGRRSISWNFQVRCHRFQHRSGGSSQPLAWHKVVILRRQLGFEPWLCSSSPHACTHML